MLRAAVDRQHPVHPSGAHLFLEGLPLVAGDDRVVRADQCEHLASDVARVLRTPRAQPGVETHEGLEVRTAPGQLERDRSAEAIADRRQPVGIRALLGAEHVEASGCDGARAQRIGAKLPDPGHHLLAVRQWSAFSVVVEGERDVAELGQSGGDVSGVIVKARTLVTHEYPRSSV